jgi:hypothetical protein
MVHIPRDADNITPAHVDRCIEDAWRKYDKYERGVNFDWPQEQIDELYRPYQLAVLLCEELISFATPDQRKLIRNLP